MNLARYGLTLFMLLGAVNAGSGAPPRGFRGDGAGLYPAATPPTTWSTTRNVLWKTPLTNWSNASPLLLGKRLFVCAEPATLICLDAGSGKILWQNTVPDLPATPPKAHDAAGYTSPTPCTDGKRIWSVFGQGMVACWDLAGTLKWSVPLEPPPHQWGGCISPRLAGGKVIVQFNHLFGLDPATGAKAWTLKTEWGWGSPVVASIGGKEILYTGKGVAVEASTGNELFKGLVRLEYNSPCLVDGVLYYLQQHPQAYALPAAASQAPRALWTNVTIMGDRYYASPLVFDGLVYAINQARILTVLAKSDGAVIYQQKVEPLKGTVYPSPTLAGRNVYLSSEGGQTVVIQAGREYRAVATNTLEAMRSCPVFEERRMYIRTLKNLWCIGE